MPTCSPFSFLKRKFRRFAASQKEDADVLGCLATGKEKEGLGIREVGNSLRSPSFPEFLLFSPPPLPPSSPDSGDPPSSPALSSRSSSPESAPSASPLPSLDRLSPSLEPAQLPSYRAPAQLPLELWAEVFGYVEEHTLQVFMLVSQTLGSEAERLLYRNVFLGSSFSLGSFHRSLIASPHRATLVTRIYIPSVEDNDPHISLADIPSLLRVLENLQHLTLNLFDTRLPRDYLFVLQVILSIRFPSLRSLSLSMPLYLDDSFLGFLQSHPHLKHLDLGEIPPSVQTDYSSFRFPAISSLACTFRLLASLRPVLSRLTHLHVLSCSSAHLLRVAEFFGAQLVGLRLGSIYVPAQHHLHHERAAMSLHDVAARFPRLRFLQLDMGQEDNRYSRVQAIDYRLKHPSPSGEGGQPGMTLLLAFARPRHEGGDVWAVAGYRRFVNKAALEVLREWGRDVVARVVCVYGAGVYESSTLDTVDGGGGGSRVVKVEDETMWEGSWRCV